MTGCAGRSSFPEKAGGRRKEEAPHAGCFLFASVHLRLALWRASRRKGGRPQWVPAERPREPRQRHDGQEEGGVETERDVAVIPETPPALGTRHPETVFQSPRLQGITSPLTRMAWEEGKGCGEKMAPEVPSLRHAVLPRSHRPFRKLHLQMSILSYTKWNFHSIHSQ